MERFNIQVVNNNDIPEWKGIDWDDFREYVQDKIETAFEGMPNTQMVREEIISMEKDYVHNYCFENGIDENRVKIIVDADNPLYVIIFPIK